MHGPHLTHDRNRHAFHMQITDIKTGRRKIELHLPANLAAVALRSGAQLLPAGYDPAQLVEALEEAHTFALEVVDELNGERIVISVD